MQNISSSAHEGLLEIFCPCSSEEIESILNFLYNGTIVWDRISYATEILDNLIKVFGFPENLLCLEEYSLSQNTEHVQVKEELVTPIEKEMQR